MKTLLCIMHARNIRACVESYEALEGCDVAWMTGFYERDLVPVHRALVESTDYDVYIMQSDDCVVSQQALDAVKQCLAEGYPAVTGWCSLIQSHPFVNLTRRPLTGYNPVSRNYTFWKDHQVRRHKEICPTGFMGMSLTGMSRELWRRFPYDCYTLRHERGHSSDFNLSVRLRDANIPMVAAVDAWMDHLKPSTMPWYGEGEYRLLVGEVPQEVRIVRESEKNKMAKSEENKAKSYPYHKGGGYYELPDGRTIKGKLEAMKAYRELKGRAA